MTMRNERRVVITGMGVLSACGVGHEPLWEMALSARSAIRELALFSANGSPIRIGGEVPGFRPEEFVISRKSLKVMSRDIQLAVAASALAVRDSGLAWEAVDRNRAGVTLGAGLINNELDEIGAAIKQSLDPDGGFRLTRFGREGIRALYPLWLLKYLPNMPACHISILHGLKGPNNTLMTSSTGTVQAIGEAYRVIQRDDAEVMLAGAADSKVNPLGIARFYLLGLLSEKNQIPGDVYRPFDRRRDGMVMGEGAGIFILEEREHALKRGAKIYGEILGYSATFRSQERAMRSALEEAGREPQEMDFVYANGTGIPGEDIREAQAIAGVFQNGAHRVPVTASKSITGHLIDGAGTAELALGLLACRENLLPPIANLETPDPQCPLHFVMKDPEPIQARHFLLNTFGFGSQSAALVVGYDRA